MTNDLYINGKKIDSFGDWSPQTEHPAITIQRKEHDERIKLEQELKMSPKEIIFVSPFPFHPRISSVSIIKFYF